jgi:hypothetical protein
MVSMRICGDRLEVEFEPDEPERSPDGAMVVSRMVPARMLWDGVPVSEVVAEALALTWMAVHSDREDL